MTQLSWNPLTVATGYDVVGGSLTDLQESSGNFTVATSACYADDIPATTFSEDSLPKGGYGIWFLVRAVNCTGTGSYDSGSASQVAPRDAPIQASGVACP